MKHGLVFMKTEIIRVGGMICVACVGRVESMLEAVKGDRSVLANIGNNITMVVFNESMVTEEQLADVGQLPDH